MTGRSFRYLLVLALGLASQAGAVNEYYSISRSIRALGMGGAFYGLSDDENAVFYNPAGLALVPKTSEFLLSFKGDISPSVITALKTALQGGSRTVSQAVADLQQFQGNPAVVDVAPLFMHFTRKYFSLGLLIGDAKGNMSLLGSGLDTTVDLTLFFDAGLFASFAVPLPVSGLTVGATLKGVYRMGGNRTFDVLQIAQGASLNLESMLTANGGGIDFDLGATYLLPVLPQGYELRASVVLNNLLASPLTLVQARTGTAPPGLPRMLTVGGYLRTPGFLGMKHTKFLLDFAEFGLGGTASADEGARGGSFWKHLNLGMEMPLNSWWAARVGLRQGNWTLGLGLDARFFQMDLATYAEEMALLPGRLTSRRFAVRLAIGLGGRTDTVPSATEVSEPKAHVAPVAAPSPGDKPAPADVPQGKGPN